MPQLQQTPCPGAHKVFFRGDTLQFQLNLDSPLKGKAFIRTNIGRAIVQRREVILKVKEERFGSAQDWYDIPMLKVDDTTYSITLSLLEVGHFEAMCFFFQDNSIDPLWPGSDNVSVNVEPAEYCCANSIYCAFPRQFGANKFFPKSQPIKGLSDKKMFEFDNEDFTIIPPSGKFRDLIKELDFIINELRCRIIHLLPINPTPTVYARMGRFGSPYASLDFTNIDPSLAVFDKKATPLEQFLELVDEIHHRSAKLIIDVAINHTGWAAKVHEEHPEWLVREKDGTIVCPGAWGVTWGDLTELDHEKSELWEYLADMFLIWTERGVDGFRCDAGYMVPFKAWEYIIARVREQYPDTIFLLEGLGGDPAITFNLLNKGNMNWAYSELFQNYSKAEIQNYITKSHKVSSTDGLMVHYAETHDNSRLAAKSEVYAKMRTGLCALLSDNGAFGFTNGVEWYAKEKIDVHEARALNWAAEPNQVDFISRINSILISHSAFYEGAKLEFVDNKSENVLVFIRTDETKKHSLLILINLDCKNNSSVCISLSELQNFNIFPNYDLITEENHFHDISNNKLNLQLKAGDILCLSSNADDIKMVTEAEDKSHHRHDKIEKQRAAAVALDIICWKRKSHAVNGVITDNLSEIILNDPVAFCESLYAEDFPIPLIYWNWPTDEKRHVMVPPDHVLFISAPFRFRASLALNERIIFQRDSLLDNNDKHFVFVIPPESVVTDQHLNVTLKMAVYGDKKCVREKSPLLFLAKDVDKCKLSVNATDIRKNTVSFLDCNGRGGMLRPCLEWGEIRDRYNCLLGANLNQKIPVDRHIMFNRARAWLNWQGRSIEVNINTIYKFELNADGGGTWTFHIPVGNGLYVDISVAAIMMADKNVTKITVYRHKTENRPHYLDDNQLVHFIFRPDIEDRSFHQDTKINDSLKLTWEKAVVCEVNGFNFSTVNERTLSIFSARGHFNYNPECCYSINRKIEGDRGFGTKSDLFSPGSFNIDLTGGEHDEIIAQVLTPEESKRIDLKSNSKIENILKPASDKFEDILIRATKQFVVRRDSLKTVIAGYPWFLDWGRDTLICVRGLIAAEMYDDVKEILLQFSKFSKDGLLPNIIHGDTVGNWDTTDAPLWLLVVTEEYCNAIGHRKLLSEEVNKGRTYLNSLKSIAEGFIEGTSNGIMVDSESMLVYSPSHFTWMDTNYPAGTPRAGYPIEIQSLWYAGLKFLASIEKEEKWEKLSIKVKDSIRKYFIYYEKDEEGTLTGEKWLSDCLHCNPILPASKSIADDHIRPNQLFAITLGAVTDKEICKSVLKHCADLLIPGSIRSLADRKTIYKLPVYNNGILLNNPSHPYCGTYEGVEDISRKPAYHNGTAWSWPFPSYCEAYYMIFGSAGLKHAKSILSSSQIPIEEGCLGQIPEIVDADYPHKQRGCDAQAWGITELYRVWKLLHS